MIPGLPIETSRLRLDRLAEADAPFLLELTNDPDWLRYIGDRGVRDLASAVRYVAEGPQASYRRHGFGLYRVDRRTDGASMGICGLVRREGLDHPDLGFAFLPAYRGAGYAHEAALAVLRHAAEDLGLTRLLAVTLADNFASIALLERLGFRCDGDVALSEDDETLRLYARDLG